MMCKTQDPSLLLTDEEKDTYWGQWLSEATQTIDEHGGIEEVDTVERSVYELMKEAINLGQYKASGKKYQMTERIAKIRIKLPRKTIEELFGVETYSIYGVGLYAKMEGVLIDEYDREKMHYDSFNKKGVYLDTSFLPKEVTESCDFRLAVPALRGLFVPKKTEMTSYLRGTFDLQYFDLSV